VDKPIDIHPDFEDIWTPEEKARILVIKSRPGRKTPSQNYSRRTVLDRMLAEVDGMSEQEFKVYRAKVERKWREGHKERE